MKLNLYGSGEPERSLRVISGGFDTRQARVVLIIVQDDTGVGGTLSLDVSEALQLHGVCANVPKPERVEAARERPTISNGGTSATIAKE